MGSMTKRGLTIRSHPFVRSLAMAAAIGISIPMTCAVAGEPQAEAPQRVAQPDGPHAAASRVQAPPSDSFAVAAPDADASIPASKPVCVDVEVSGKKTLSFGCLSAQLAPHGAKPAAASESTAEALAKQPSNQVGTFNLSTSMTQFGNAWGKSTTPQRPAPFVFVRP